MQPLAMAQMPAPEAPRVIHAASALPLLYLSYGQVISLLSVHEFWLKEMGTHPFSLRGAMVISEGKLYVVNSFRRLPDGWVLEPVTLPAPRGPVPMIHIQDLCHLAAEALDSDMVASLCAVYQQQVAQRQQHAVTTHQVQSVNYWVLRLNQAVPYTEIYQRAAYEGKHTLAEIDHMRKAAAHAALTVVTLAPTLHEHQYLQNLARHCVQQDMLSAAAVPIKQPSSVPAAGHGIPASQHTASQLSHSDAQCTGLDTHLILYGSPALEYEYMDNENSNTMEYSMKARDFFQIPSPEDDTDSDGRDDDPDQDPRPQYEDYETYEQEQGHQWQVLELQGQVQDLEQQLHECALARDSQHQKFQSALQLLAALTTEVIQLRAALAAHKEAEVQGVVALEARIQQLKAIVKWKEREVVSSAKQLQQAKVQLAEVELDKHMLQQQLVRELQQKQKSSNRGSGAPSTAHGTIPAATPSTGLCCAFSAPAEAVPPAPSRSLLARASSQLAATVAPSTTSTTTAMHAAASTTTRTRAAPRLRPTPQQPSWQG